jgi:hypothetical protein
MIILAATAVAGTKTIPVTEGSCSAIADCEDGSTVACTGSTSCLVTDDGCPTTRGNVVCDGATTWCPKCTCPMDGETCYDGYDCLMDGLRPCVNCFCVAEYPYPGFCACIK